MCRLMFWLPLLTLPGNECKTITNYLIDRRERNSSLVTVIRALRPFSRLALQQAQFQVIQVRRRRWVPAGKGCCVSKIWILFWQSQRQHLRSFERFIPSVDMCFDDFKHRYTALGNPRGGGPWGFVQILLKGYLGLPEKLGVPYFRVSLHFCDQIFKTLSLLPPPTVCIYLWLQ